MSFVRLHKCEEDKLSSSQVELCCDVVDLGHATHFTRDKNNSITRCLNGNAISSSGVAEVVCRFNITQSWNRSRSSAGSLTNAILQPSVNHENSFWCFHCSTGENFLWARAKTFLNETSHISLLLQFCSFLRFRNLKYPWLAEKLVFLVTHVISCARKQKNWTLTFESMTKPTLDLQFKSRSS